MNNTIVNNQQKTSVPSLKNATRKWYYIDLKNKVTGRVASQVTTLLRGKNNSTFIPHLDTGHFVVLVNAQYIRVTGNKLRKEKYYDHSGYPGGLRQRTMSVMLEKYPRELVFRIVKGMMPNTKLSRQQLKRLFIFPTQTHNLLAQQKEFIAFEGNGGKNL